MVLPRAINGNIDKKAIINALMVQAYMILFVVIAVVIIDCTTLRVVLIDYLV